MTQPPEIPPFKAWRIHQTGDDFSAGFETLSLDDLSDGEVVIEVVYSGVNYKDAMAGTDRAKILRKTPLVGGIDLAGKVLCDASGRFCAGDAVFAQGGGLGEIYDGGYAPYARLPAAVVMAIPDGLDAFSVMAIGTAGFTAAYAIELMERNGRRSENAPVLVTGATGGVGSFAVHLLARLGYRCVAATRKSERADYLKGLGADEVIGAVEPVAGALGKAVWAGAIDNLGGAALAAVVKTTRPLGNVVCVGRAASEKLPLSVIPFIIRGVGLLGVTSANCPMDVRRRVWQRLAGDMKPSCLDAVVSERVGLERLPECFEQLIAGRACGRFVVVHRRD